MNSKPQLDCGCVPGEYLCSDAQHLYVRTAMAWSHARRTGDHAKHDYWRALYDAHFETQEGDE